MAGTDPTRTASSPGLFKRDDPWPGLLLAWAPPGTSSTDRARVIDEIGIGRGRTADWIVDDDRISSLHFRVSRFGAGLLVEDLESRNGTFVNGERITEPRAVTRGALVRAGRCIFLVHDDLRELEVPPPAGGALVGPFFAAPLLRRLDVASRTGRHILLAGASGTGKELCARWLAAKIAPGMPVVAHNCARSTSPEEAESTLWGVGKGVFSGVDARAGLLEEADGGVLFLDEVHTLPRRVQQSLLRFSEDGQHARIGTTATRRLTIRLVLATNIPVLSAAEAESSADRASLPLAPDLLARLTVVQIPSLAERRADVPAIFQHALGRAAAAAAVPLAPIEAALGPDAYEALCLADWSGRNVRGLEELAAELVAASADEETVRRLLADRLASVVAERRASAADAEPTSLYERHRDRIVAVFGETGGNLTRMEKTLREEGIQVNRRWLADYLRRWGLRA